MKYLFLILFILTQSIFAAETTPLRVRNDFKTPEEVIRYYCERDADGFIWVGITEVERKAFTLWKTIPEYDSFLIARNYRILPSKIINRAQVEIQVEYDLVAISDAHGTRSPPPSQKHNVQFRLKKMAGKWLIAEPLPNQITPVVKE